MKNFAGLLLIVFLTFILLTSDVFAATYGLNSRPEALITITLPAKAEMRIFDFYSFVSSEYEPLSVICIDFARRYDGFYSMKKISGEYTIKNKIQKPMDFIIKTRGVGVFQVSVNGNFYGLYFILNDEVFPLIFPPWPQ